MKNPLHKKEIKKKEKKILKLIERLEKEKGKNPILK